MTGTLAILEYYDEDGRAVGNGGNLFLPPYLDWMPIEVKVFWFLQRCFGEPRAKRVLFKSQGEQRLVEIKEPLRQMKHTELKEIEDGLWSKVDEYIAREGFSRTPRNQ